MSGPDLAALVAELDGRVARLERFVWEVDDAVSRARPYVTDGQVGQDDDEDGEP